MILFAGSPALAERTRATCGVERWTVKTLQDRPRLLPAKNTTIAYLVSRPAPAELPNTRLPFERHIFRVTAAVTLVRHEADDDFSHRAQRRAAHDDRRVASPLVYGQGHPPPASSDGVSASRRASVFRGPGGGGGVLRFPARSDGGGAERD
jgi:hypothetical protein